MKEYSLQNQESFSMLISLNTQLMASMFYGLILKVKFIAQILREGLIHIHCTSQQSSMILDFWIQIALKKHVNFRILVNRTTHLHQSIIIWQIQSIEVQKQLQFGIELRLSCSLYHLMVILGLMYSCLSWKIMSVRHISKQNSFRWPITVICNQDHQKVNYWRFSHHTQVILV